jgi:hypothetical protein
VEPFEGPLVELVSGEDLFEFGVTVFQRFSIRQFINLNTGGFDYDFDAII